MYSKSSSVFKFNQIKLTILEFERLCRHKSIVFHVLALLWFVWFDYYALSIVEFLFRKRWDLVEKTCGFGSQYITIWNQVILQVYFIAVLIQDLLSFASDKRIKSVETVLNKWNAYFFASVVFPISFVVCINFWIIYSIETGIVDEHHIMEMYVPDWVNHGLHTFTVLLVCLEMAVVHRPTPNRLWAFVGIATTFIAYCTLCCLLYNASGLWPYPVIRDLSDFGKFSIVSANFILGYIFICIGEHINERLWDSKNLQTSKKSKVS